MAGEGDEVAVNGAGVQVGGAPVASGGQVNLVPEKKKRWRLPLVLGIIATIICVAVAVMVVVFNNQDYDACQQESELSGMELAASDYDMIRDEYLDNEDFSFDGIIDVFEDKLSSENDAEYKIYLAIYFASFMYEQGGRIDDAVAILDAVSDMTSLATEDALMNYYSTYHNIYTKSGDLEKAKEYADILDNVIDITEVPEEDFNSGGTEDE